MSLKTFHRIIALILILNLLLYTWAGQLGIFNTIMTVEGRVISATGFAIFLVVALHEANKRD